MAEKHGCESVHLILHVAYLGIIHPSIMVTKHMFKKVPVILGSART